MAKHHPDLVICREMPGIQIGRLCERCDGRCPICDSHSTPSTQPAYICDSCNFGAKRGRCIVCGGPGFCDAVYCRECVLLEKDRDGCPRIVNISGARLDMHHERKRYDRGASGAVGYSNNRY